MTHVSGDQQTNALAQGLEPESITEDDCEVWGGGGDGPHPDDDDDEVLPVGSHAGGDRGGNDEEEEGEGDMEEVDFNALLVLPDDGK